MESHALVRVERPVRPRDEAGAYLACRLGAKPLGARPGGVGPWSRGPARGGPRMLRRDGGTLATRIRAAHLAIDHGRERETRGAGAFVDGVSDRGARPVGSLGQAAATSRLHPRASAI